MKCEHDVNGYEWKICSKCGKLVRVNEKRRIIRRTLIIVSMFTIVPAIADWLIDALNLANHNPYNMTHALLGCIPLLAVWVITYHFLPVYDVKNPEE